MQPIIEQLLRRKEELESIRTEKRKALAAAPPGCLRISTGGGRTQYYHRKEKSERTGTYIPRHDLKTAMALAQKEYDRKVLELAEREEKAISRFLVQLPEQTAEEVYPALSGERQKLVLPIWEPDEQYAARWRREEYVPNPHDKVWTDFVTDRGERVRSKSELIIANQLERRGIPYRYECPVYLEGPGTVYPDFTVLNVRFRRELLWEHLGMMDDPEYVEKAVRKQSAYLRNGYIPGRNLILTAETRATPLSVADLNLLIESLLL